MVEQLQKAAPHMVKVWAFVQQTIGALVVASILALFSNWYSVGVTLERHTLLLEHLGEDGRAYKKFMDHGSRFSRGDAEKLEESLLWRINQNSANCKELTSSVREHHERAEGGWAVMKSLQKDQHNHNRWQE